MDDDDEEEEGLVREASDNVDLDIFCCQLKDTKSRLVTRISGY